MPHVPRRYPARAHGRGAPDDEGARLVTVRRSIACRDYHISEARCGGWKVRHRRTGLELTAAEDGRVALVTWPTAKAAIADIAATYEPPKTPPTPPRRLRAAR